MWIPALIYTVGNILAGFLSVYAAETLAVLTDAVFASDFQAGISNIWQLAAVLAASVFLVPAAELCGSLVMLNYALRHERVVLSRFLDKTYEDIRTINDGEARQRIEDDVICLRCDWVMTVERLISTPLLLGFAIFHTFRESIPFALITASVSFCKLIIPILAKKAEAKYNRETEEYKTQASIYETELAQIPYAFRLFGLSDTLLTRLEQLYQAYFCNTFRKSARCSALANTSAAFLDTFCVMIILLSGAVLVSLGSVSPGTIAAMTAYISIFGTVMHNIDFIIRKRPIITNTVERLKLLYDNYERQDGKTIGGITCMEAENLSYAYQDSQVLNKVRFKIIPGSKTAVCGANGCGKTTLLRILCGLNKVYSGSIRINGTELRDISPESLRKQIAFVEQDPFLFQKTIRENIHLGNLEADTAKVDEIMQLLGIEYLASRQISMDQNGLSGGEKQKISIARALLKNTPIIFMDEPGNHLDVESIQWLQSFLQKTKKTILFVSHDPSLTELADQIIRL